MRTFVMGDLHGNYYAFLQCLERSGFNKRKDRLIQLGDIVDGKCHSFECVEELLSIKNLISIKGNHDEWFREFLTTGYHPAIWEFGGEATIRSYLKHAAKSAFIKRSRSGFKTNLDPKDVPLRHHKFFESQLPYFIDESNNCFVHGGFDRFNTFQGQQHERYFWDRELWSDALNLLAGNLSLSKPQSFYCKTEFNNVFIGHTQTLGWKSDRPMKAFNIYNLDTGAGGKGKLTIMNVETKEWFQSDKQK